MTAMYFVPECMCDCGHWRSGHAGFEAPSATSACKQCNCREFEPAEEEDWEDEYDDEGG